MIEHVVDHEQASHEHFPGGDPAPVSVPGAERTVDAAPVDPAHVVDAGDARHGLFGGHALCNEGMDAASASILWIRHTWSTLAMPGTVSSVATLCATRVWTPRAPR